MTTNPKPPPPAPSPFLTLAEIAAELRVDVRTVRRWVRDRQLPAIQLDKGYRVHRQALDHFLGDRHTSTTTAGGAA